MSIFKKHFTKTDLPQKCPVCFASVFEIKYTCEDDAEGATGKSFFYRCQACSFIFARPVLIPKLNQRQMDGVENAEMFNSKLLKWLYTNLFIKKEITRVRKLLNDRKNCRLLDIGCGTGWTSKVYQDHGFSVTGLEPSPIRAEIARERYGLHIINDYLENLPETSGSYDVVVLRHIIEHFAELDIIMQKVRSLLSKHGIIVVVVPNINCLGRYLFETNWTWVLPWHCNFFTPKSVRLFIERLGFGIVAQYQTPSPLYFPDSLIRAFPDSALTKFIVRYKTAARLVSAPIAVLGALLGLGDNLNVFARKKE